MSKTRSNTFSTPCKYIARALDAVGDLAGDRLAGEPADLLEIVNWVTSIPSSQTSSRDPMHRASDLPVVLDETDVGVWGSCPARAMSPVKFDDFEREGFSTTWNC